MFVLFPRPNNNEIERRIAVRYSFDTVLQYSKCIKSYIRKGAFTTLAKVYSSFFSQPVRAGNGAMRRKEEAGIG